MGLFSIKDTHKRRAKNQIATLGSVQIAKHCNRQKEDPTHQNNLTDEYGGLNVEFVH